MQVRTESCELERAGRTPRVLARPSWLVGSALATLLVGACGGGQSQPAPAPASPAYTTSGSPDQPTHTMPDGTVMPGHQHGEPGPGQHVMPDGTVMPGHQHVEPGPGQHVMPDGTVMPGDQHPPGDTHVMPDGTVMPGAHHGAPAK